MSYQSENQASNNRPRAPKLPGTSEAQIKRQGKPRERTEISNPLPPERGNRLFQTFIGLASVVLIILGIVVISALVWMYINTEEPEPTPAIVPPSFIHTEITREIKLATSTDVTTSIKQHQEVADIRAGGFWQFYFTHIKNEQLRLMTPQDFFSRITLNSNTLPVLSYAGSTFMYGHYANPDGQKGSYIILPITDYESAYGSLLQSEKNLSNALESLGFPIVDDFRDAVINNQDVRFATSTEGAGIYWSFPEPTRLVITADEATLRAVFSRLEQTRRAASKVGFIPLESKYTPRMK